MIRLESCNAKFERAVAHLRELGDQIEAWRAGPTAPYHLDPEANDDLTRHRVVLKVDREPPLTTWSLIAADCVHNLRATLDQVVYAIAVHECGRDTPPHHTDLAFPIADTPRDFDKIKWRIETLSELIQQAIEASQPYHHPPVGVREPPHPLSVLRDFENADKHRLLRLAIAENVRSELGIPLDVGEVVVVLGPMKGGGTVGTIEFRRPTPLASYDFKINLKVSVDLPAALGKGRVDLHNLLNAMAGEVRRIVDRVGVT